MAGHFAIGSDRRIVEWDAAAARMLGVAGNEALGMACSGVIGGKNDFGCPVCGQTCPAAKALAEGSITGTSRMVALAADGARLRLVCDLIALPSGGALGRLREAGDERSDLAHDLAGVAAVAARVSGEPLQQGLRHALDFLLHATVADAGEVFLAEPHGNGLVRTCHRGRFERAFDQLLHFDTGEGIPGLALSHGKPVYTDHLAEDPRFLRTRVKQEGFRTYVCNPLVNRGDALGCVALAFRRSDVDLERVTNLLRWVGTPMGPAVESALAHLRDAAALLLRGVEDDPEHRLPGALRALLQEMVRLGGADGGELFLPWTATDFRLAVTGADAVPPCPTFKSDTSARCPAYEIGTPNLLRGRRETWPLACRHTAHPGGAWCCIPMLCDGESLGVIRLRYRRLRPSSPSANIALLEGLASLAAEKVRDARARLAKTAPLKAASSECPQRVDEAPDAIGRAVAQPIRPDRRTADSPSDETLLRIRCLGPLELSVDGVQVAPSAIRRKRVLTLLGILLTHHGRPQDKDMLIEMLWPGADPDVRKRQFHVLVHELRRLLEPDRRGNWRYVRNQGDRYVFDARSPCWIDVLQFRALVDLGHEEETAQDRQAAIDAYEAAAGLYRGDYMQDEPSGEWCWQAREHLREICLDVLNRLPALWGELGRWDRSVAWLRSALLLDPLREKAHRALMYSLWACGRRDEAVRQYEACAHLLRERLDLTPLPETQKLFALIRATPRPHSGH